MSATRNVAVINEPFLCVHGGKCAIANDERPHFLHKHKEEKESEGEGEGFVVRNAEGWREYEAAVDDTYR
jgi:hypothetical protein